jgi:2-oxo-3-hexenedioate decarboxylase
MRPVHAASLASELLEAYDQRRLVPPPSTREGGLDLPTAYATEAEIVRRRAAAGHRPVGLKVGFANKAAWRLLKLETLVWAHMYEDTVVHAGRAGALSLGRMCSPRIEPEIVFKLRTAVDPGNLDPGAVLGSVEWLALGFEIVDSVFADWKFQPADFVAAYGLHAALVVGEPHPIDADSIPTLVEQLPQFRVRLMKDGAVVAEGSGKNSLRSPALCLGELASAIARRPGEEPLRGGELVSSGTLTEAQSITPGETWMFAADGIDLGELTLTTTP